MQVWAAKVKLRHVGVELELVGVLVVLQVVMVTRWVAAVAGSISGGGGAPVAAASAIAVAAACARIERRSSCWRHTAATACSNGWRWPGPTLMVMVVEHGQRVIIGDHPQCFRTSVHRPVMRVRTLPSLSICTVFPYMFCYVRPNTNMVTVLLNRLPSCWAFQEFNRIIVKIYFLFAVKVRSCDTE